MTAKKQEREASGEEKILPFYNLSLDKQINLLKAYVAFHDKNNRGAHYKEVASIAGVHQTQASGCRKFWRYLRYLAERNGTDVPTQLAMNFVRKLEWASKEEAWKFLRGTILETWFVSHVTMTLKLQKTLSYDELTNSLGSAAELPGKQPHAISSLRILMELLVQSRVIEEDKETRKFMLHPELVKGTEVEPLELSREEQNLILVTIDNERYVVSPKELMGFIRTHGKKVTSREYTIRDPGKLADNCAES